MILENGGRTILSVDFRVFMEKGPRQSQEDAVLAGARIYQRESMEISAQDRGDPLAFVVCDGMGGHAAGEVCSQFVLDEFKKGLTPQAVSEEGLSLLLGMIQNAAEEALPVNSGTTIAGVVFFNGTALVFNAGDSRVYRIRDGQIKRCSHDHSYVQGLVDKGAISEMEAFKHPYRNVVSFGIGSAFSELWGETKVHVAFSEILFSDTYFICSDGVSDLLEDDEIEAILKPVPLKGAYRLRRELNRKGLKDNTSYILLTIR